MGHSSRSWSPLLVFLEGLYRDCGGEEVTCGSLSVSFFGSVLNPLSGTVVSTTASTLGTATLSRSLVRMIVWKLVIFDLKDW